MLIRYPRGFDHLPRRCPATMFSYGRRRSAAPCSSRRYKKKPSTLTSKVLGSGDVLLSHGLSPYYHRGCSVSLPCSEWERVVPLRYDHQRAGNLQFTMANLQLGAMRLLIPRPLGTVKFSKEHAVSNRQSQIENPKLPLVL